MSSTKDILHDKFNPRSDHIPPVRIKGFTREKLARLFAELGYTAGAEVGVAEGHFSRTLCENIPGVQLYCCDLWDTYYRDTTKLKDRRMQDNALALAHEKLDQYNTHFIRKASMDAVREIADRSLDFVYIDADHSFDFTMQDLIEWSRKVRRGGIVAGHDWYKFRGAGVVEAVNAYTNAHQINEWFIDDQRETSFFWANDWR